MLLTNLEVQRRVLIRANIELRMLKRYNQAFRLLLDDAETE